MEVSFTPRPLYPRGNSSWCLLDRKLGGPRSLAGRDGGKILASAGNRTTVVQRIA